LIRELMVPANFNLAHFFVSGACNKRSAISWSPLCITIT
jgi:hypothetical protein